MKQYLKIILLLVSIVFSVSLNAVENNNAQNEGVTPRIPTKEEIEDYKKSSDFNYERVYQQDQSWWDDFKKWLKDLFNELFDFPEVKSFDYWEAIMWVLITIAVLAIIYFGFRNEIAAFWGKRNVKSSTAIKTDFVDLTEDTITLETKLQNAIAQKEYAEAIRLYYTISLKSLIDAGLVEFRIDKTNSEYLFEIPTNTIRQPFKQLTFYFDYIFYGEFEATENIFLKTQEQYNILATHLKKAPTH